MKLMRILVKGVVIYMNSKLVICLLAGYVEFEMKRIGSELRNGKKEKRTNLSQRALDKVRFIP